MRGQMLWKLKIPVSAVRFRPCPPRDFHNTLAHSPLSSYLDPLLLSDCSYRHPSGVPEILLAHDVVAFTQAPGLVAGKLRPGMPVPAMFLTVALRTSWGKRPNCPRVKQQKCFGRGVECPLLSVRCSSQRPKSVNYSDGKTY